VTAAARSRPAFRVHGRSFLVLVLRPEPPIDQWLAELDGQAARSPTFLESKPVVVDLGGVTAADGDLPALVRALQARGLRILSVEGADPSWAGNEEWGHAISGGRPAGMVQPPGTTSAGSAQAGNGQAGNGPAGNGQPGTVPEGGAAADPEAGETPEATGLVIDSPVRSGQSVIYPEGDVTVVGSVASGAEVFAGGSVHVYGTLRGRVVAGFTGNPKARVFCRKLEAELVAIDGVYRTADDMDAALRGKAVHAWLEGDSIVMTALD
jgi:septum site-determining protein MinC